MSGQDYNSYSVGGDVYTDLLNEQRRLIEAQRRFIEALVEYASIVRIEIPQLEIK
jgi:outer membrane protein TolC